MQILKQLTIAFVLLAPQALKAQWRVVKQEMVFNDAPFKQCHASTLLETKDGSLLVACFGGAYEGSKDVAIWMKTSNSKGWGNAEKVADGFVSKDSSNPCWNPVLFEDKKGKTLLYYKVGPNPRDWWGMVAARKYGKSAWVKSALPAGILGPIKNKPVQLANGTILSPSSTEDNNGAWHVHVELSTDNGRSWRKIYVDTASPFKVIQPAILQYGNRLQMLCRSNQQRIIESWSEDGGKTWSKLALTSIANPNSGIDAVTLKDGSQMLVYNPTHAGENWWDGRSKLAVATSADGKTWKDILMLEDLEKGEFSYPAIIQAKDGSVHISYTYDRKNIKHVVLGREQ